MAEIRVPELGESIVEGTVGTWLKNVGDVVAAGDAVVELETDKVNLEVIAEDSGVIQQILKQTGETVGVGEVLGMIGAASQSASPATDASVASFAPQSVVQNADLPAAPAASTAAPASAVQVPLHASPSLRRMAREQGVDIAQASPAAGSNIQKPSPSTVSQPSAPQSAQLVSENPREERVRMSRRRQTIAERLVQAQHNAAMLTTFNEIDMTAILDIRKRRKDPFKEKHGIGLGFMSFFTKAVVGALKAFPYLNAEIQGEDILLKHYYDIGIAVSTDAGLVVPVVRGADSLSFAEIESEIANLAEKARSGRLSLPELMGGSFTITNGGTFGSLMSTPILNAPQVGILGMHKIQQRPVAVNGQVEIRPMMYVALSYDHRIVDGSEAVRFLVTVKELAEDPESLLLEG